MKKNFFYPALLLMAAILFQGCASEEERLLKQIKTIEEDLFSEVKGIIDREKALKLVQLYQEYADVYPESEKAPEYLFRAGDVCMNTGYPQRSVDFFARVHREYPLYEKVPESLFLMAFVLENQMLNLQRAELTYKRFLELYPDHDLAEDAEILLQHLGKSPDELVREFEQRLKEQEGL